jgi:DNA-binding beta-propeller fold protein YncE
VTFRTIQIEKGVPGYARINPRTNTAYISYTSSNFIIAVNLEKGTIENKIQLTSPGDISINDVTNKVYVAYAFGICEIDGVNNQYGMINIGLPHSDGRVDVNPLTNLLYTTCFGHDILTVIDAATQAIADKVPVGKNAKGVAVDTKMNKIYVANYDSYSISVIDCCQSNQVVDCITFEGKDSSSTKINPNCILVNELSNLLYVNTDYLSATGGAWRGEVLYVIDMNTKEKIKSRTLPSNNEIGFAYNYGNNTIYMMRRGERSILKFEPSANETLDIITFEQSSIWRRIFGIDYTYFAEVIAVNPSTNKLYVSDSKSNLLYEMDG